MGVDASAPPATCRVPNLDGRWDRFTARYRKFRQCSTLPDLSAEPGRARARQIVVGGNGVSGAEFVDNAALREWAFDTFDARVLDMESAAVAHVAWANDVPFIAFCLLSDLAGGGKGENEMSTFVGLAASNSAEVMRAFLAALD